MGINVFKSVFGADFGSNLPRSHVRGARQAGYADRRQKRRDAETWGERPGVKKRRGRRAARRAGARQRIRDRSGSDSGQQGGSLGPWVVPKEPIRANQGGLVSHKSIYDMEKGG